MIHIVQGKHTGWMKPAGLLSTEDNIMVPMIQVIPHAYRDRRVPYKAFNCFAYDPRLEKAEHQSQTVNSQIEEFILSKMDVCGDQFYEKDMRSLCSERELNTMQAKMFKFFLYEKHFLSQVTSTPLADTAKAEVLYRDVWVYESTNIREAAHEFYGALPSLDAIYKYNRV